MVATEACRLAANGPEFIARVQDELGLELEIVDRQTEAYLAVTGCAALADPYAQSVIVFDIGGGSTEIAWLDGVAQSAASDPCKRIRAWDSLPAGVVTLAERHGGIAETRALAFDYAAAARVALGAFPESDAKDGLLLATESAVDRVS